MRAVNAQRRNENEEVKNGRLKDYRLALISNSLEKY